MFQQAVIQNYLALSAAFIYNAPSIIPDFMGIMGDWTRVVGVH